MNREQLYYKADSIDMALITAKNAVDRLVALLVSGELDTSIDADMDALAIYAEGITSRIEWARSQACKLRAGLTEGAQDATEDGEGEE